MTARDLVIALPRSNAGADVFSGMLSCILAELPWIISKFDRHPIVFYSSCATANTGSRLSGMFLALMPGRLYIDSILRSAILGDTRALISQLHFFVIEVHYTASISSDHTCLDCISRAFWSSFETKVS